MATTAKSKVVYDSRKDSDSKEAKYVQVTITLKSTPTQYDPARDGEYWGRELDYWMDDISYGDRQEYRIMAVDLTEAEYKKALA